MLFLNPLLLWALLAAAVPIAIHLINRRRHKTIAWAAMQFLLKATRESRGKKKLRHLIILTCRALALAALALAAARPVVSEFIGWSGGRVDTVVLILDRSASMEIQSGEGLKSRREQALEKIRAAVIELGSPRLVLIDSASGTPLEISSADTLTALKATAATETAADFPSLLMRAGEILTRTVGSSEIWLASDLQASNWQPEDPRWLAATTTLAALPRPPAIRILAATGVTPQNTALQLLGAQRVGDEILLNLELFRSPGSCGPLKLPLTTHLNGARLSETLTLPSQSLKFQKRIALAAGSASGMGYLTIPADGNPLDNTVFFAQGPDLPFKTLLVSPNDESAAYLTLAAAPPGLTSYQSKRVDPENASAQLTADLTAVLWAAHLPQGDAAASLTKYVVEGGQVVFFPPKSVSTTPFLSLSWSEITQAATGKFFTLKDWNRQDGPLSDAIDGTPLPAEKLKALRRQVPQGEATTLARWEDGEPFLTRRIVEKGTMWCVGTLPDYAWSNLGDGDVLLPLVQRILNTGSTRFDSTYLTRVGDLPTRLLPSEIRTRLDDATSPDPANAPFQAGLYNLGERLLAINRPAQEDAPEVVTQEQLDAALKGVKYTRLDQISTAKDASLSKDVWREFLVLVLIFLIVEAALCLPGKRRDSVKSVARPVSFAKDS